MDAAQVSALVTALMALPLNGILLVIIITLWRRLQTVTDELMECHKQNSYPTPLPLDIPG